MYTAAAGNVKPFCRSGCSVTCCTLPPPGGSLGCLTTFLALCHPEPFGCAAPQNHIARVIPNGAAGAVIPFPIADFGLQIAAHSVTMSDDGNDNAELPTGFGVRNLALPLRRKTPRCVYPAPRQAREPRSRRARGAMGCSRRHWPAAAPARRGVAGRCGAGPQCHHPCHPERSEGSSSHEDGRFLAECTLPLDKLGSRAAEGLGVPWVAPGATGPSPGHQVRGMI